MASRAAVGVGLAISGVLGLAVLGWLLRPAAPITPEPAAAVPGVTVPTSTAPETATDSLMQRAREQLAQGALISPAGANAVETYLSVLAREPGHLAARAAAIEMQPVVSDGIRGALAGADWAEADRLLGLLRRLDPASVLLEPLSAELAQRQAQVEAAEQARLAAASAPLLAEPAPTVASAPSPAPSPSVPVVAAAPPAATLPASVPTEPVLPSPAAPPPPAPTPALAAKPEPRETPARLLNNPPVVYPPQARRQRLEGWVEVEVQIDAAGTVTDVRVVRAEPPGVFDREALRTAQRWRFAPREVDGLAVQSTARRRVAFSLGAG